jgi:hypothetical protein
MLNQEQYAEQERLAREEFVREDKAFYDDADKSRWLKVYDGSAGQFMDGARQRRPHRNY